MFSFVKTRISPRRILSPVIVFAPSLPALKTVAPWSFGDAHETFRLWNPHFPCFRLFSLQFRLL
jgi:hypothetical protein